MLVPRYRPAVPSPRKCAGAAVPPLLAAVVLAQLTGVAVAADTTPPAPVSTMKVTSDKKRVKLDWANSSEVDRAGYLVYRSATPDGAFTRVTPQPVTRSEYSDYSVTAGFPMHYRVTVVDTSGNESPPVPAVGTRKDGVKPARPTSLTAARGIEGVALGWADGTERDLAGYVVWRSTSSKGTYTKLTAAPLPGSAFLDVAAAAGTSYWYRVAALDFSGSTSSVATVAALVPDASPPAPVRALVASASTTSVKLDWASSGESDLAGYHVYRSDSADGTFTELTTTIRTSSNFRDTSAPVGVLSHYRVVAVDRGGNESAPAAASATRKDRVPPAAPTALTASAVPAGVLLDWADSPETDIAGYVVSRATSSGGRYTPLTATPLTSSTFTDTTATPGATSYYRVTAVDVSGNTSRAASATAVPADESAPAPVSGMTTSADTSRVELDWTSSTEPDLATYRVYRASAADGEFVLLTTGATTKSEYADYAAPAGVPSFYRVTAVDRSGNESAPVSASAVRRDRTPPAPVTGLTAVGTAETITVDWADSPEPDLVGYVVSRADSSDGTYTSLTATPVTDSAFVDTSAPLGAVSHYRVTAVDLSGNTSSASGTSASRVDTVAPAAPTGLEAAEQDGQVTLTWSAGPETDLAGYAVYRWADSDPSDVERLTDSSVTGTTYVDATVTGGASYTYALAALDTAGNESPRSAPVSVAVADRTAPSAPAGLTATASAAGTLLHWTEVIEGDVAGYRVYRAPAGSSDGVLLTGPLTPVAEWLDTSAPEGSSTYWVTAVDRTGNESPASTAVEAAPLDTTAPVAPGGVIATGTAAGVELDWADNQESDLAGYLVYRSDSAAGTFTRLTTAPAATSDYIDSAAPTGTTAYYQVSAVDRAGNESLVATAEGSRLVERVPVEGADLTVAQDGSGDHTTIAEALAAAPAEATPFVIAIRPGTYRELLTVSRPNVTLLGATGNAADVVITYDNAALTPKPDGGTYGTSGSATVLIKADGVTTRNLTIENSYVETGVSGEQAVALKTTGDRLVFDNVRLLGDQDTLYADSPGVGKLARSYYVNSYVEGDVDFVFGRGTAVFDRSTIHASSRGSASNNGYLTAASTDITLPYGFLVTDSTITSDAPAGTFHLGRPWHPSGDVNAIAQVVIRDTVLPAAVKAAPWTDMSGFSWREARFFEYRNTGDGAAVNPERPQLTDVEATRYTKFTYLAGNDGWNPTGQEPPADTTAPAAPTSLAAAAADSSVTLTWAAGTDSDLAGYQVYRSTGSDVALTAANRLTPAVVAGATYTDRTAANGTTYSYVVTAVDRAGNESVASSPVTGTPVGVPLPAHDVLVAADGSGQFTTVQAAVDAAVAGTAAKPTVIAVKPGVYTELVTLAKNHVHVIGTTGDARDVVITYGNAAGTPKPDGSGTYGTSGSQTVLVRGSNVTVKDVTIENSFDEAAFSYSSEQAVALHTTGDRLVFDGVRLLGNQDTLLVNSPDAPVIARSYFVNSYVEGDVDFIFGRGTAVFHHSTIHALSRGSSSNNGYITAASTSDHNPHGFLIAESTITSNAPAGTFSLGRPWRGWGDGYTKNGVVYNSRGQVTVRDTELPAAIRTAQPWADMSPNLWTDGRFSEYGNTGAGATVNANRPQLTDEQAAEATPQRYLAGSDGWNPVR